MVKRKDMTQEQKQAQNKSNAPHRAKYEAKTYSKILLRIRNDGADGVTVEDIKAAAAGGSVNGFILDAIREKLNRQQ